MSRVGNLSLEQPPKRRSIDPSSPSNGRSINNLEEGIKFSHEALSYTKQMNSRISWIEHKKLHLVLDLDLTLVRTIRVSNMSESDKCLVEEAGSRNDLWRFKEGHPREYLIKLRPFVHGFLKKCNEMFCMSVYTKASPGYAQLVLKMIDPGKVYFGDRVVTKRESPGLKTLDLVLADERGIVIVDDTPTVWPDHQRNLLQIAKYKYFRRKDDLSSEYEKERYESDENGRLAGVLSILEKVHKDFFSEKFEEKLDSVDVRPLLQDCLSRLKRKAKVVLCKCDCVVCNELNPQIFT